MIEEVYAEHPLISRYLAAEARYKAAMRRAAQAGERWARLKARWAYAVARRRCLGVLRQVQIRSLSDAELADQAKALGLVRR